MFKIFMGWVINDSGRPKIRVEYKGETKTFYAEEVSSSMTINR